MEKTQRNRKRRHSHSVRGGLDASEVGRLEFGERSANAKWRTRSALRKKSDADVRGAIAPHLRRCENNERLGYVHTSSTFVQSQPDQSISSGIFRFGGGKVLSSFSRSSSVSWISNAARFWRMCSALLALGIAIRSGSRSTQASAI